MVKITIEVSNCKECPHFKEQRHYTADSFEIVSDWFCKKENDKKIAGYVEWHKEDDVKIPDWCPCSNKTK